MLCILILYLGKQSQNVIFGNPVNQQSEVVSLSTRKPSLFEENGFFDLKENHVH